MNMVGVSVCIRNQIAAITFPFLLSKKDEIEAEIVKALIWNTNPENRDKVIVLLQPTDFSNAEKVKEVVLWLTDHTIKFRDVFSKLVNRSAINDSLRSRN